MVCKDDDLAEHDPWVRLLFRDLPMMADREGRLEDRPRVIKAELFPYDDVDVDELLSRLARPRKYSRGGFIMRYEVDGERFIQIRNFSKYQKPHQREAKSVIPAPPKSSEETINNDSQGSAKARLGNNKAAPRRPDPDPGPASAEAGESLRDISPKAQPLPSEPAPKPKPKRTEFEKAQKAKAKFDKELARDGVAVRPGTNELVASEDFYELIRTHCESFAVARQKPPPTNDQLAESWTALERWILNPAQNWCRGDKLIAATRKWFEKDTLKYASWKKRGGGARASPNERNRRNVETAKRALKKLGKERDG